MDRPGSSRRRVWAAVMAALAGLLLTALGPVSPTRPLTAPTTATAATTAGTAATTAGTHGDPCRESMFAVHGTRQLHTFTWVVDVSGIPAYLDRAGAVEAMRRATATIDEARSPCPNTRGLSPALPPAIYAGPTERQANVTPDAECFLPGNSDGANVVSFGRLPPDVLAVTCTYTHEGEIWQSDIMLNDEPGLFTLDPRAGRCRDSYDLQAIMTHERGHSFGLAHVPEGPASSALTMSSIVGRCDDSGRTLGWGDVLGLSLVY